MGNLIKNTFVFTYDRYTDITTSEYLKDVNHTVLCHTTEQRKKFTAAGKIHGRIIETLEPKGLSNNRNYALSLMKSGEWAAFWVDDLIAVTRYGNYPGYAENKLNICKENQNEARKLFKTPCDTKTFYQIAEETVRHAESKGYCLVGFSLTNNPMFRRNKYSYRGLADGRCWIVKKTDLRFDTNVQLIDDTCFTALNLKYFGGVVVNNWLLPDCKRYTAGSFGSKENRMEQKIKECSYLVKAYPKHIKIADKVGWPKGSHVAIR